jgi:hypothetical protein
MYNRGAQPFARVMPEARLDATFPNERLFQLLMRRFVKKASLSGKGADAYKMGTYTWTLYSCA